MSVEWVIQLAALLGGVRKAWILQAGEVEQADAIEEFAKSVELQTILSLAESPVARKPFQLYRKDIFLENLHEVVFSVEPLGDVDLWNDSVRAELLNYRGNYKKVLRRGRTQDTLNFTVFGGTSEGRLHDLFNFRCLQEERQLCSSHADMIRQSLQALLPKFAFRFQETVTLGALSSILQLRSQVISSQQLDSILNTIVNAGLDQFDTVPQPLTEFQKGMLFGLGLYSLYDPLYSSKVYPILPESTRDALFAEQSRVSLILKDEFLKQ